MNNGSFLRESKNFSCPLSAGDCRFGTVGCGNYQAMIHNTVLHERSMYPSLSSNPSLKVPERVLANTSETAFESKIFVESAESFASFTRFFEDVR